MSVRSGTWAEFCAAVARLGLPVDADDLETLWAMVRDLSLQAAHVRAALDHLADAGWSAGLPSPAPADGRG
jgi:hypothetical protein